MKKEELIDLIAQGETNEFVTGDERERYIGQTACAFLNGKGGMYVLGIHNGDLTGVRYCDNWDNLEEYLAGSIFPAADIKVERVEVEENSIAIVITVPAGDDKPYSYDGDIYFRRHNRTKKINSRELYLLTHLGQKLNYLDSKEVCNISVEDPQVEDIQSIIEVSKRLGLDPGPWNNVLLDVRLNRFFNAEIELSIDAKKPETKFKYNAILKNIHLQPGKRMNDYIELTGIPIQTLERYVSELKKAEIIEHRDKGYHLTKKITKKLEKSLRVGE